MSNQPASKWVKWVEETCAKCHGAGLVPSDSAWAWGVELCMICNGYGTVLVETATRKPVAFDYRCANGKEKIN